jgi:uncharacterized phage protein (TIGR02218 family)
MPRPDPALAAHLLEGATTLCRCWKLIRRDGVVFGFTDHDRDLTFGGVVFAARAGLDAAEVERELGFAAPGGDVSGALTSTGITEADIAAGRYDGAVVETWSVVWTDPSKRLLIDAATLGEIRRADGAFVAELRSLMHRLDEERGRVYRGTCDADLGDARCGVDPSDPRWRFSAGVASSDGALTATFDGLGTREDGLFTGGRLVWTTGANAGLSSEIKLHKGSRVELWARAPSSIVPGDMAELTAGCDRRFSTCRSRFANAANFRGFPHMPGNDFVLRVAQPGEAGANGGSLFR